MSEHRSQRSLHHYERQGSRAACARINDALGVARHKKPTRHTAPLPYIPTVCNLRGDDTACRCTVIQCIMGLCLSVALWKEKLYGAGAGAGGRQSVRGRRVVHKVVAGVEDGDCEYGILGGNDADVLLGAVEQKRAAVAPAGMGVRSGGVEGAAGATVSAAGTPVRPIWQRRVLMGVKCQLPRFSGMILYDESGRPVCSGIRDRARDQEKHAAAISVLRDLL